METLTGGFLAYGAELSPNGYTLPSRSLSQRVTYVSLLVDKTALDSTNSDKHGSVIMYSFKCILEKIEPALQSCDFMGKNSGWYFYLKSKSI